MADYPRYKTIRKDVTNDPWGFCHQVMKNMIARNPYPEGSFQLTPPAFNDPIAGAGNMNAMPSTVKKGFWWYKQWINCLIDYEDEMHPTCLKQRYYVEKTANPMWLAKWDDAREAGDEFAILIRQKRRPMQALYQPFKVLNPGMYEYDWLLGRTFISPEDLGRCPESREMPEALEASRVP